MDRDSLLQQYQRTRALSLRLVEPLAAEDFRVQSLPEVSPPYWSLGHTSWFFARNVLHAFDRYDPAFAKYEYSFNSYYEGLGPRLPRALRGQVARPGTEEVFAFRSAVDQRMAELIVGAAAVDPERLSFLVTVGCQHEQQHQELLLSEILHIRSCDPVELRQPYRSDVPQTAGGRALPLRFVPFAAGTTSIGSGEDGFAWDNERPVHRSWIDDHALANRLVTNAEWLAFVDDGGYRQPLLWLSNGWARLQEQGWQAPLYWQRQERRWRQWTLRGFCELDAAAPVCHVSFYEAEAFARWFGAQSREYAGARLPTEREWEHDARSAGFDVRCGNFLDDELLAVRPAQDDGRALLQTAGDAWEWTSSHHEPYPGYRPFPGALTEYNGKFMDNQRVLRGGSFATPRAHVRVGYRNFWPADTRFQFAGVRLLLDPAAAR